jgi:hypothetical protein
MDLRKLIDVPRVSFESMMRKRARTALARFSGDELTFNHYPLHSTHAPLPRSRLPHGAGARGAAPGLPARTFV